MLGGSISETKGADLPDAPAAGRSRRGSPRPGVAERFQSAQIWSAGSSAAGSEQADAQPVERVTEGAAEVESTA